MGRNKKLLRILLFTVLAIALLVVTYRSLFEVHKLIGSVGRYESGSNLLVMSRNISKLVRPIKEGDIILFRTDITEKTEISVVVGLPGKEINEHAYDRFAGKYLGEKVVPNNSYLIGSVEANQFRIIPDEIVEGVAWYSFGN